MAETDVHRQIMMDLIATLQAHFAADPLVYVSGDLLLFYEEGNKRRHVAPDVFVVRGVPNHMRDNYLLWLEGKGPDIVIEVTSKTTRREDQTKKRVLYRDVLRVPEYFQFDPTEDYLRPPFQGDRLVNGNYEAIEPIAGRLPSAVLGLHLERAGTDLRLFDPTTGRRLLNPREQAAEAVARATEAQARATEAQIRAVGAEAENERLRQELEELRRRLSGSS
jgi:Uma2 family endonuclease